MLKFLSMIHRGGILVVFLVFSSLHVQGDWAAYKIPATPRYVGGVFPLSPAQKEPWSPAPVKTEANTNWVAATKVLFDLGLADPRKLEYREIEVVTSSVQGEAEITKTRGWLLPNDSKSTNRYAVTWSGLVYPVVRVGSAGSLDGDIATILRQATQASRRMPTRGRAIWEKTAVSAETVLPVKICLLMRLDRMNAAEDLIPIFEDNVLQSSADFEHPDPFLMLGDDWVWFLCDRAFCAHQRGDDTVALLSSRQALEVLPVVEKEAERRGFKRPGEGVLDYEGNPRKGHYFRYVGELPALVADQERRAKSSPAQLPDLSNESNSAKRIAALIDGLDQIFVPQLGQPGGMDFRIDSLVQGLIKEGEAAVESLIQCLESDSRLTRSFSYHRDFFRDRHLHSVAEAAMTALQGITGISLDNVQIIPEIMEQRHDGRKAFAAALREHVKRYSAGTEEERWFLLLADDKAGVHGWLEAASKITTSQARKAAMEAFFVGNPALLMTPPNSAAPVALAGEKLRRKANPTVTELMTRRVTQIIEDSKFPDHIHTGSQMALCLARWDRTNSVEALRAQFRRCIQAGMQDNFRLRELGRDAANVTVQRGLAADKAALEEYETWIKAIEPDVYWEIIEDLIKPMSKFASDPAMVRAAEWLFKAPESPWKPFRDLHNPRMRMQANDLLEISLIGNPGFQPLLFDWLRDNTKAGTVTIEEGNMCRLQVEGGSYGSSLPQGEIVPPEQQKPQEIRWRDMVAHFLRFAEQLPTYRPYWPEPQRDKAIEDIIDFLKKHPGHVVVRGPREMYEDSEP